MRWSSYWSIRSSTCIEAGLSLDDKRPVLVHYDFVPDIGVLDQD